MLRVRRDCPEIGRGKHSLLASDNPAVFAISYQLGTQRTIIVHNLSGQKLCAAVDAGGVSSRLSDLLGRHGPVAQQGGAYQIDLPAYGSRWLRAE